MKYLATIILTLIICALFWHFFLRSQFATTPDNSEQIALLEKIKEIEKQDSLHLAQRDSLLKLPKIIDRQIIYREGEIDESIAKDSTNALVQYKQSLTENGWLPDESTQLTFREIGIGSKLMAKVPSLELKVKQYEEIVSKDEEIFKEKDYIIKGYKEVHQLDLISIKSWEEKYNSTKSFSDDRAVVYGGIGVSYGVDNKLQLTLQLGVGLRIITLWAEK